METYHIVSHTHWDREWYQPFEQFRLRLVDLLDHVLEIFELNPDYVFELDAQTVCLEDYLEIRPYRRRELEKFIRSGNLRVGPWYVQNDFALTSGEATVRNLLIGSRGAREFGACGNVGYAPDQFGLIRQLPQILVGFGLDSCIFGRGFDRRTTNEFYWQSPDGSRVVASFLSRWYNNLQRLSADPERARGYLQLAIEQQNDEASTSHRLLMNGVDHLEAQEDLLEILKKLEFPNLKQSTLRAFVDGVKAELSESNVIESAMRDGLVSSLLSGTLSARSPLKVANVHAQAELELKLEPLATMLAAAAGDWEFYEGDLLHYAWKLLLKNQPHDSICGCSTDRVHEDNFNRFARLKDLCAMLESRIVNRFWERLERSTYSPADYLIAVFNPAPYTSSEEVTAKLYLPLEENIEKFVLYDSAGQEVDFEIISVQERYKSNFPAINLPGKTACMELDICFVAEDLPPMGYRVYMLKPHCGKMIQKTSQCRLENEFLSFSVGPDGNLTLHDKNTGKSYSDLLSFEDEADLGHSYIFIPEAERKPVSIPEISAVTVTPKNCCIEVEYRFVLPCDYDFGARRRTDESVENRIVVRYSLPQKSRHLNIEFEVENRSKAHRLRALFRHAGKEMPFASAPFGFEQWARRDDLHGEANSGIIANADYAIFNAGLFEYEHKSETTELTLLRCIGRVTNTEYPTQTRIVAESYEWDAPEANMIGNHVFHAAIRPGLATLATLEKEFRKFLMPAVTAFESADKLKFNSGRPCVQDTGLTEIFVRELPPGTRTLPSEHRGFSLEGDAILSACKKAEEGAYTVLRVYNPDFTRTVSGKLNVSGALRLCNLAEEAAGSAAADFQLKPGQIQTFLL